MRLPSPRGSLSSAVTATLVAPARAATDLDLPVGPDSTPEHLEDAALALWVLQELHYRGFDDVDEAWEWHPGMTGLRVTLERELEDRLRARWAEVAPVPAEPDPTGSADFVTTLTGLIDGHDGPSLARHLHHHGTSEQALDLLRQRSIYHLKEADPTAWVIPRLGARTKAALVEIQYDEYGAGDPTRLHHQLFARGMAASGLTSDYGHYVDEALTEVLEQNTVLSMLGLHRRLRAAALGHFAAFEATSSLPSRRLAQALRRLGLPEAMADYYDEHVEADAVHEHLALRDVCGSLVEQEPDQADDVLFGAWTCLDLETRTANAVLERWGVAA